MLAGRFGNAPRDFFSAAVLAADLINSCRQVCQKYRVLGIELFFSFLPDNDR